MIDILGFQIHEFSIALSDLLLFSESIVLAGLLWVGCGKNPDVQKVRNLGILMLLFLGAASFLGSIFHAFFPLKTESLGGFVVWVLTTVAIGLVAVTIMYIISILLNDKFIKNNINTFATSLFVTYLCSILFIDHHYSTVISFYLPVVLILGFIGVWKFVTEKKTTWAYLVASIVLSVFAAGIQFFNISIDPVYLNYNTLYHLIQGASLVLLYLFFSRYSI